MSIDPTIQAFYEDGTESDRLETGPWRLEALRTRSLIKRFTPDPPVVVLDVGGGAGSYALWLAALGYHVHVVDPVGALIAEAARRNAAAGNSLQSLQVGDARALPFRSDSADCVLLLGPLYHLVERAARLKALAEAYRVLKSGGVLFAAAVSRWASALHGIAGDLFEEPEYGRAVRRVLRDGQHRNPTGRAGAFTTAYFHRPEDLQEEVTQERFQLEGIFALEGFAGFLMDFDERWSDRRQRAAILRFAEAFESEPSLLGATPHLLAVARKAPA